jgi:hypothetical protein
LGYIGSLCLKNRGRKELKRRREEEEEKKEGKRKGKKEL